MKVLLLLISIVIPAILCAEPFNRNVELEAKVRDIKNRMKGDGLECVALLSLPLMTLVFADKDDFNTLCSPTPYFNSCDADFKTHCRFTGCDLNVMYPWVKSFPAAGNSYICKNLGYDAINATYEHGGPACISKVGIQLDALQIELYSNIWNGKSANCSSDVGPINTIGDIIDILAKCDNKKLRDFTTNYYNEVLSDSPCKDYHVGAGVRSAADVLLAVVAMAVAYMATTFQ